MKYTPPEQFLREGAVVLGHKLYPLGFTFSIVETGRGSGGHYAVGSFKCRDREIFLGFRFHLGRVSYRKGSLERGHVELMQALGLEEKARYPGFQTEQPLEGFNDLLADFEHCSVFFEQEGSEFEHIMRNYVYRPPPIGFNALSRHAKH